MSVTYREAGVDLEAAERVTADIKQRLGNALFGGFVPLPNLTAYREPVLVSSIDGVGTKVLLAARLDRFSGLAQDIVHHCVNDIAVHGALPLLFLDYLALHRLESELVRTIVNGIADACEALGVRLAGGETAEMPLVYPPDHFDIAGAVVGVVDRAAIVDGSAMREGDTLIGLPSSGLHTNGYSLIHRLFTDSDLRRYEPSLNATLGEALLEPHRCYLSDIQALLGTGLVHGLAHVTGGGIAGNLARILPSHLQALVHLPGVPPIFRLIQERGVPRDEMLRVFNMGVGMVAVCDPAVVVDARMPRIGSICPNDDPGRRVVIDDRD